MKWAGLRRWDRCTRAFLTVNSEIDHKGFHRATCDKEGSIIIEHRYLLVKTQPTDLRRDDSVC